MTGRGINPRSESLHSEPANQETGSSYVVARHPAATEGRQFSMARRWIILVLLAACLPIRVGQASGAPVDDRQQAPGNSSADQSVNQVVQWNRTLLVIVRTAG